MLRRSFLKTLAAIAVAPFVPFVAPAKLVANRFGLVKATVSFKCPASGRIIPGDFLTMAKDGTVRTIKSWSEPVPIIGVAAAITWDGQVVVVASGNAMVEELDARP
jgi:hypothetical protein